MVRNRLWKPASSCPLAWRGALPGLISATSYQGGVFFSLTMVYDVLLIFQATQKRQQQIAYPLNKTMFKTTAIVDSTYIVCLHFLYLKDI